MKIIGPKEYEITGLKNTDFASQKEAILALKEEDIDEEGIQCLCSLISQSINLQYLILDMKQNKITVQFIKRIAFAMSKCKTLSTLQVKIKDKVEIQSEDVYNLFDYLSSCKNIKQLIAYIENHNIQDQNVLNICETLAKFINLSSLTFLCCNNIHKQDQEIKIINKLKKIKRLVRLKIIFYGVC
ncbi:hypothetical protein ABPG73_012641 [Tetrahymena malaccensis]